MKKLIKFLPVLAIAILAVSCSSTAQNGQSYKRLDAASFQTAITQHADGQLIDVRTPGEYAEGHIANARNINVNGADFSKQIKTLDTNLPVLVYCRSGHRSSMATKEMKKIGFKEIYELDKGIMEWQSAGLPIVK